MSTNNERDRARDLNMQAMTLLAGLADHADEAGMEDLVIYFSMARTELALGPWPAPDVDAVPEGRVGFAEGVRDVLDLLDEVRALTDDRSGVIALALARLWVVDGVAWLDAEAAKVAAACRARTVNRWLS